MRQAKPSRDVCKFLNDLKVEKIFNQIWKRLLDILKEPNLSDSIKIGEKEDYIVLRNDIGEYRIIYYFDENYVYFMIINKRNDGKVYKLFKNKYK